MHHRRPGPGGGGQQVGRLLHLALGDQAADPGGGDGLGRDPSRRGRPGARCPSTSKPAADAHLAEQGHVPLAAVAEVEVLPHHHQPGPEAVDEYRAHELLGRLVGPLLVEGDDDGPVHPGRGQQFELLVEVAEQGGRRLGPDHRGRMAVEGHHHRGQPVGAGPGPSSPSRARWPRWTPS